LPDAYLSPVSENMSKRELIGKTKNRRFRRVAFALYSLFKEVNQIIHTSIRDKKSMDAVILTLTREFDILDLEQRMDWYADLNFTVERFNEAIENKITPYPNDSLSTRIKKYYLKMAHKQLNSLNERFYKLTYPESTDLNDPEYLEKLIKAYKNTPKTTLV
jgi:hypothetical protein